MRKRTFLMAQFTNNNESYRVYVINYSSKTQHSSHFYKFETVGDARKKKMMVTTDVFYTPLVI